MCAFLKCEFRVLFEVLRGVLMGVSLPLSIYIYIYKFCKSQVYSELMEPEDLKEQLIERRNTEYREESPWRSGRQERVFAKARLKVKRNNITEKFDDHVYANMDIDVETKRAGLLVSPSVVSLVSLEGRDEMFRTSGTIVECNDVGGKYSNTILTSASLIEPSAGNVKVKVYLDDGRVFDSWVFAYDRHYNLALVNIKSETALPVAVLRFLDDSASVDPREASSSGDVPYIRPHVETNSFRCIPGEKVVAVGRHINNSELMVAPGQISLDVCPFDCKELTRATCKISKCGIGGPLVNCHGEMIGVNFYDELYTPFLPTNVVSKCLEYFKKNRRFCRPCHGMEVTNLYAADLNTLETVVFKFDIFKGVIVRKVLQGSPANSAGIIPGDVIIECSGEKTRGRLEFFGQIWEKTGESVELVVVRKGMDGFLKLSMVVCNETRPMKFNHWPLPKECTVNVRRVRPRDLKQLQ